MAKQVNCSYDFVSGSTTYWTSEWSADGYEGRLTDMVYKNGTSYTDWCLFAGTDEECAQFIAICEEKGMKPTRHLLPSMASCRNYQVVRRIS